LQPAAMFCQGSAYKFAAKLSPAQRDPNKASFFINERPRGELGSERISAWIASHRIV